MAASVAYGRNACCAKAKVGGSSECGAFGIHRGLTPLLDCRGHVATANAMWWPRKSSAWFETQRKLAHNRVHDRRRSAELMGALAWGALGLLLVWSARVDVEQVAKATAYTRQGVGWVDQ